MCELLCYKVMNLMQICDQAKTDLDLLMNDPRETHVNWTMKFLEVFKGVYKLEKHRYQDPKMHEALLPFAKFIHNREKAYLDEQNQKSLLADSIFEFNMPLSNLDTKEGPASTFDNVSNQQAKSQAGTFTLRQNHISITSERSQITQPQYKVRKFHHKKDVIKDITTSGVST